MEGEPRQIVENVGVESGSDDRHFGYFLVGQVVLIRKLNYLDVTRISHFFRKQYWNQGSE